MSAGSATKNPLRVKFFIFHFPFKFPGVMTISKHNTEMNHMLLSLIFPSKYGREGSHKTDHNMTEVCQGLLLTDWTSTPRSSGQKARTGSVYNVPLEKVNLY